eukprot:maker-scaffold380_size190731-snap-gene-0.34 protein:Tk02455 transcript:maker-scaffold380_size190731-snap-gene-0.34-mRNA-1 annotation:"ferredoxin oxidoreductase"
MLSVSIAKYVAKMLESKCLRYAIHALPRARTHEVLEAGDHGRGHLVRLAGGPVPVPSRPQTRHSLPNIRALCQPCSQHAGTFGHGWIAHNRRIKTQRPRPSSKDLARELARGACAPSDQGCGLSRWNHAHISEHNRPIEHSRQHCPWAFTHSTDEVSIHRGQSTIGFESRGRGRPGLICSLRSQS